MRKSIYPILGQKGAHELLQTLDKQPWMKYAELYELGKELGVDDPDLLIDSLSDLGCISKVGKSFNLTVYGKKNLLLMDAIGGEDLRDIFRKLWYLYPHLRSYELVTEGMTQKFVSTLYSRPEFRRIYLCSPWIDMDKDTRKTFLQAKRKAEKYQGVSAEIFVMTRPIDEKRPWAFRLSKNLKWLYSLGAEIVTHKNLHSKLYVVEPGMKGGLLMAIFGSENLTRGQNIELGIKITNDNILVNALIKYFVNLFNLGTEWEG